MHSPGRVAPPGDVRRALAQLRRACRSLPELLETLTFGHPTLQAGKGRTFAVLDDHERPGLLCLVVKLDVEHQQRLVDHQRFFPSKFGSKHGWTAMRVDARADWKLARQLVVESYRRVALRRMLAALDAPAHKPAAVRRGARPSTARRPQGVATRGARRGERPPGGGTP
jgi:predicted DNA-binding protein (MmcQ/YjbR family)